MKLTERETLIEKLRVTINANESTRLTFKQVEHYIGCDMPIEQVEVWLDETITQEGVTAEDVLALWDKPD